jgi:membrane protease YdiL (CAAX protease family)
LKDAARLLGYFVVTVLFGALVAPLLYWPAQALAARGVLQGLAQYDFESFFHRALLLGALLFLWPLLRSLAVRDRATLGLEPNRNWPRHLLFGFLLSMLPVILCEIGLIKAGVYSLRDAPDWAAVAQVIPTAAVVPILEESLFRGLFLGILLRGLRPWPANLLSAAIFSIIHFLKAPDQTSSVVQWYSGFVSLAHAFDQFRDPMLVLAGFTTIFVIGIVLADARIRTRSLWMPIGLHAGWILSSMTFGKFARRELVALPWIGKTLLVGLVPLVVCLVTWVLVRLCLKYGLPRRA